MKVFIPFFMLSLFAYEGSRFQDVWDIIGENPYEELPQYKVSTRQFFANGVNRLLGSANRTLKSKEDILPSFKKLLHPNGICLKGTWEITQESPYSGYFATDSQALLIARASTTLSNTLRGGLRGFALAGKVFPTKDSEEKVKTGNFFLIDNLGGTYQSNYSQAIMSNTPAVIPSFSFSVLGLIGLANTVNNAFSRADSSPGVRQLYPISELGNPESVRTPKWMRLQSSTGESISNERDFRNEISEHIRKNGQLSFKIQVASSRKNGQKNWKTLGNLIFTEAIASLNCDSRLHFAHPKFKPSN